MSGDAEADAALVATLREAPDDPDRYLVYADWLLERGDPRGLWIATALEAERAPTAAARHAALAREAALLAEHDAALRGPLRDEPRGAARWRWGFAARAGIARPTAARAALAHPAARVVQELVVGEVASPHELAAVVAAARAGAPCLRALHLGVTPALLEPAAALPAERFQIRAAAVPPQPSADWITARARAPADLWIAALRWGLGIDPERHRRPAGAWEPAADRYLLELASAGCDDAWIARELARAYALALREPAAVPPPRWLAAVEPLRAHASPRLAEALWRYIEYQLATADQRRVVRDPGVLLWPLAALWHPVLEPALIAYVTGHRDRRAASPAQRRRRARAAAWLCERVDAPALAAALASGSRPPPPPR